MNLQQYQTNLTTIKELLRIVKSQGLFADNITQGHVTVTIDSSYFRDPDIPIGKTSVRLIKMNAIRKVDIAVLELLRLADACGVDIIDDLIEALPTRYPNYATDIQEPLENFLEGELK